MANVRQIVLNMAAALGLKTDKNGTFCHGFHCGYPFLLEAKSDNRLNELKVQMCATNMGQPMTYEMFQNVMLPQGVRIYVGNYRVNLAVDGNGDINEVTRSLADAIAIVTDTLQRMGFTGCDELGGIYNISLYSINGSYSFYSIDNVSHLEQRLEQIKEQERAVKERIPLGILAGLGGVAIGAAATIVLGKLGYISFYASVLMTFLTITFYKKAAKKFTVVSAIITGIMCLASSIIIPRLSTAISLYDIFRESRDNVPFSVCFAQCRQIYSSWGLTAYYFRDVILMAILGIAGAAAFIFSSLKETSGKDKIKKIG